MSKAKMPSNIKSGLENACKKVTKEVSKAVPGKKNEKKVADLLAKKVCKNVDQKLLKLIAQEIAKTAKKASSKANDAIPKVSAVPTMKKPGSGVPSFTIPLPEFDMGEDAKGKFKLKVWGDPKQFEKKEKGAMVFFTVEF